MSWFNILLFFVIDRPKTILFSILSIAALIGTIVHFIARPVDYCPGGELIPIGAKLIGEDKGDRIIVSKKTVYACIKPGDVVAPPPTPVKPRKGLNKL